MAGYVCRTLHDRLKTSYMCYMLTFEVLHLCHLVWSCTNKQTNKKLYPRKKHYALNSIHQVVLDSSMYEYCLYIIYIFIMTLTHYFFLLVLVLVRLYSEVFSGFMRDFPSLEPLQFPLIVAHVELIMCSACAFFRHWLELGFSWVPPLCCC